MALLLSPAGSFEALRAAIDGGADEVYLGGMQFNARAGAKNFDEKQLIRAGELCREHNVRLLITLNTLIKEKELEAVLGYVSFLQEERVKDAMAGLKSAGGYLRRQLGNNLKLRYAPEIVWALDDSITYGAKMLSLINSLGVTHDDEESDEG